VRLDVQLFEPVGGAAPPVSAATGFGSFSGGAATGTDFVWPEVGIVQFRPRVGDGDYLGAGDVSGVLSQRVGRFVPDHFAVAFNTPLFGTACGPGGYTYTGESFHYATAPVLTAIAQSVQNTTTLNYRGDYRKLGTGTLPVPRSYTASQALDLSGLPLPNVDPVVVEVGPGVVELRFSGGTGLAFDRGTPVAPFNADVRLSIDVIDTDGAAAPGNPQTFGAPAGIAFDAGGEIRYGRLRFVNAVGSELVNLAVPLRAEYFAGAGIGFVTNLDDSCTTGVTLALSNFTENLALGETCSLDIGAPGNSNIGCAAAGPLPQQFAEPPQNGDFNLTLAAPGAGDTGSVTIESTVPDWLRFDWDAAAAGDESPSGQAAFGLYGGNGRQIYLREIYN
jgi:MSHA biogenesis protein MshQ